jgi:protein SCO1/2
MTWLFAVALAASDPRAVGLDEHLGARVPDVALVAPDGARATLRSLFDGRRPIVLVMAYARCEMLCSVVLRGVTVAIGKSRHALGDDYLAAVVSLDPDETPAIAERRQAKLLAEVGRAGARDAWPYFVSEEPQIETLSRALGFRYAWDERTRQFAHPAVAFVLTPDGRVAEYLRGVNFDELDDALDRARAGLTTTSLARDILRCFHFDPALRRYGRAMQLFLRLGAATIAVAVAALVVGLFAWERRRRRRAS